LHYTLRSAALVVTLIAAVPARAAEPDFAASFPAKGLIDLNEGTIEYWIKFDFDPQEQHDNWRGRASVFWLDLGDKAFPDDGWSATIGTRSLTAQPSDGMAAMTRFAITLEGKKFPHPAFSMFPPGKAKEWHHFALTWSGGRAAQAFVDGKPSDRNEYHDSFIRSLGAAARVGIGHDPRSKYIPNHNPIALDDFRISAVTRKPEELGFSVGALKPDRQTLLLLDFEHGDDKIVPAHSAAEPTPTPVLPKKWKYVDGKFGRALSLDPAAS
jgi:hypothetical protein